MTGEDTAETLLQSAVTDGDEDDDEGTGTQREEHEKLSSIRD